MKKLLPALLVASSLLTAASARATYSIIAIDVETGQVGGVGTSCVGSFSVYAIYGVVPGVGVVAAQASLNEQARDRAVMLLAQGSDAAAVIADITRFDFDPLSAVRQYAVIDMSGAAVGFTGASTMAFADDQQGNVAPYVYSVQGNILTSAAVLSQASAVFGAPGCDLADTLMRALEAGALNGEGDSRCTPEGIPSDAAFIEVNLPDQGTAEPLLHLEVVDTSPASPVSELRALYDAWRATHPCPEPTGMLDAGVSSDGGMEDAGGMPVDPPQAGTTAPPLTGGMGAGTGGAGGVGVAGSGGSGGVGGAVMPMPQQPRPLPNESDSSGCAIARASRPSYHASFVLVLAAVLAVRSRRAAHGRSSRRSRSSRGRPKVGQPRTAKAGCRTGGPSGTAKRTRTARAARRSGPCCGCSSRRSRRT